MGWFGWLSQREVRQVFCTIVVHFIGVDAMTKSVLMSLVVAATIAAGSLFTATGWCGDSSRPARGSGKGAAQDTYQVMKIDDEYKVVTTKSIKDEKKRVTEEFSAKVKEWQDEKKTDPTLKRPTPPRVTVIVTKFNTQKGAQDYVDKLLDEADSKGDTTKKK
jgi:hypothetical protein